MSTDGRAPRWIDLDGAVNARAVVPGVLLRADNLQSLSPRDVRALIEEQGLEVVIDLRTDIEVELEGPGPITAEHSVRIEHRSLFPDSGGHTDLDADMVRPWREHGDDEWSAETPVVRAYLSYLRRRPDSVVGSIRAIARARGAVLVHCAAGKDRTGVVVALALDAVGVPRDAIIADYMATGERVEEIMARLLSSPTYRAELEGHDARAHAPVGETMLRVLDLVDHEFGGSAAWLSAHGLEHADLERLKQRLTGPAAVIELEGSGSVDELRDLWLELHHHHGRSAPGLAPYVDDERSWAVRRDGYLGWLRLPDSFLLVARVARRPVGYAMVRVDRAGSEWTDTWVVGDRIAELETLVVAREHRGRGLGSALLDRMESELEARGVHDVVIGVVPGNDSAQRLYERRGYVPTWMVLSRFERRTRRPA